ncbi:MAG: DUF3617 domain-containing protein [Rhodocyclaceae bacterium]|nr:DUF3617 domain-containing protein [Rhodocyclaceae bacterium]
MNAIRRSLAAGIAVAALPFAAAAQGSGLKPGLWEVKQIKQVMDGQDMGAQMAAAQAQMQQAFANMPPAQRKQMEAMMAKQGMAPPAASGGQRICISPEMAARDKPMVDPEGRCEPTKFNRSGNRVSFEVNCSFEGQQMSGKGESTTTPESVATRMDMVMTGRDGRHTMQSETQMRWLGADCGAVKPADQMVREMQGGMRKK